MVAVKAGVEGVHGVHFAASSGAFGGGFGFERGFRVAEGGAVVVGLEALLIKVGEGVGNLAGGFFVLKDGVDGEAEGDYFYGEEAGEEPRSGFNYLEGLEKSCRVLTTLQGASIC